MNDYRVELADELPLELRKLSEKATQGPWDVFVGNANDRGLVRIESGADAKVAGIHIASLTRGKQSEINADFAAACVNYVRSRLAAQDFANRPEPPYVDPPELITKEDGTPIGIRQKVHLGGKGGATK